MRLIAVLFFTAVAAQPGQLPGSTPTEKKSDNPDLMDVIAGMSGDVPSKCREAGGSTNACKSLEKHTDASTACYVENKFPLPDVPYAICKRNGEYYIVVISGGEGGNRRRRFLRKSGMLLHYLAFMVEQDIHELYRRQLKENKVGKLIFDDCTCVADFAPHFGAVCPDTDECHHDLALLF